MDNPSADLALESARNKERVSWLDITLAVLVALYGISTAGAAYLSNKLDGDANDAYFNGVSLLNNANSYDLTYQVNLNEIVAIRTNPDRANSEAVGYMFSDFFNLTPMEADGDTLSTEDIDDYLGSFEDFLAERFDEAEIAFLMAETFNDDSDRFQVTMLMLAVGLSFVAWASLGHTITTPRLVFTLVAGIILVVGVVSLGVSYGSSCGFRPDAELCALEVTCDIDYDEAGNPTYPEDFSEEDSLYCDALFEYLESVEE